MCGCVCVCVRVRACVMLTCMSNEQIDQACIHAFYIAIHWRPCTWPVTLRGRLTMHRPPAPTERLPIIPCARLGSRSMMVSASGDMPRWLIGRRTDVTQGKGKTLPGQWWNKYTRRRQRLIHMYVICCIVFLV